MHLTARNLTGEPTTLSKKGNRQQQVSSTVPTLWRYGART